MFYGNSNISPFDDKKQHSSGFSCHIWFPETSLLLTICKLGYTMAVQISKDAYSELFPVAVFLKLNTVLQPHLQMPFQML